MFIKYWLPVMAIALLGGCAAYKGLDYDPATGRTHGAKVDPGATVKIGTILGAEIRSVNGRSVIIGGDYEVKRKPAPYVQINVGPAWTALDEHRHGRQEYMTLRGRPGRYELEAGIYVAEVEEPDDPRSGARMQLFQQKSDATQRLTPFDAAPGDYWVMIVKNEDGGQWIAVVTRGSADNRILAAPDQRLVGATIPELREAMKERARKKGSGR